MRAEAGTATPARRAVAVAPRERTPPKARGRRRLDRFDAGVLAVFALVSVWVLALDLWQVAVHGRVWTGTDGLYVVDQMQYLAWINSASHHLLSANLFVLRPTPADYFQPAIAISGLLTALGIVPWLSLLLWKPVAVVASFLAIRAYANRALHGLRARRAALVLGLFYGSFSVVYGSFGVVGDLFPGFLSWGYTFGLIALAIVPAALLAYDRARAARMAAWIPGLLGALSSSLHPWQGELLVVIVLGAEVLVRRGREPGRWRSGWRLPALTVGLTGIPLIYYLILGHTDLSWSLARDASKHTFALWTIVLALVPLAIPAAFAYRRRARTFFEVLTRIWPLAVVAVYVFSATGLSATPLHAFDGITIPLAVLAVQATQASRWRYHPRRKLLAIAAVALLTVPATVYEMTSARTIVAPQDGNANFITHDEKRALDFLARSPVQGGVVSRFYLGTVVPGITGRPTFVGDCLWSEPRCTKRARFAQYLLEGSLVGRAARRFVRRTGARFVLSDCDVGVNLRVILAPITQRVYRFGCASVYEIWPRGVAPVPPRPTQPSPLKRLPRQWLRIQLDPAT